MQRKSITHTIAILGLVILGNACDVPPENQPTGTRPQPAANARGNQITHEEVMATLPPGVELSQTGLTCLVPDPLNFWPCLVWQPAPPPGFNDCMGDTNAYDGEIVIFSADNYQGWCFWRNPPAGTSTQASFGDLDSEYFRVNSFRSRLAGGAILFSAPNYNFNQFWVPVPFGSYDHPASGGYSISSAYFYK